MIKRFVVFFYSIWDDMKLPPRDAVAAIIAGIIIAVPVTGILFGVAHLLCWITNKPYSDDAIPAAAGLLLVIGFLINLVIYLRRKWREAQPTSND
jgi:hypothetical protein